MTDALAAIVDVRGQPPRQGDGDHGRGLLLDHPDADPCASLLATGAAIFGAREWWPDRAAPDLRTLLWRRLAGGAMPGGSRPTTLRHHFADAGMVLLRDRAHGEDEIWCRCDHGPHGFLSIAAHAHADALSIELRCGGVEVLVDPGTYTYQGEAAWRSYFRSTIAHNCLELAGAGSIGARAAPSCGRSGRTLPNLPRAASKGARRRSGARRMTVIGGCPPAPGTSERSRSIVRRAGSSWRMRSRATADTSAGWRFTSGRRSIAVLMARWRSSAGRPAPAAGAR